MSGVGAARLTASQAPASSARKWRRWRRTCSVGLRSSAHRREDAGADGKRRAVELGRGRGVNVQGLTKSFAGPDGEMVAVDDLDLQMFEGQVVCATRAGPSRAGRHAVARAVRASGPQRRRQDHHHLHADRHARAHIRHRAHQRPLHHHQHARDPPQPGLLSAAQARARALRPRPALSALGLTAVCARSILFPLLTPREHLQFFALLKGMEADAVDAAVTEKLEEVGLPHEADSLAGNLSGGTQRKLSVVIALIGDSKIVFLVRAAREGRRLVACLSTRVRRTSPPPAWTPTAGAPRGSSFGATRRVASCCSPRTSWTRCARPKRSRLHAALAGGCPRRPHRYHGAWAAACVRHVSLPQVLLRSGLHFRLVQER